MSASGTRRQPGRGGLLSIHRLTATGPALPSTAWARYVEIAAWPSWSPQITGTAATAERIAVGVQGSVSVPGGLGLPFTITAVDPDARTWSWVVQLGVVPLTLNHAVRGHRRGSATDLVMEGPALVLTAYAPFAWLALRQLVARP